MYCPTNKVALANINEYDILCISSGFDHITHNIPTGIGKPNAIDSLNKIDSLKNLNWKTTTTTIFIFTDGIFCQYLYYYSVGN